MQMTRFGVPIFKSAQASLEARVKEVGIFEDPKDDL